MQEDIWENNYKMKDAASIILFDRNKKILLQLRTKDAPVSPSKWGFFGGSVEENETPLEAVKRECYEELEYDLKKPLLILEMKRTNRIAYVFAEKYDFSKKLNLKEGEAMKWFSVEEAKKLDSPNLVKEVLKKLTLKT